MTVKKAELMLLKIGNGASPEELFSTVGGLRTTRMMVNRQLVTATDVTSQGWRRMLEAAGMAFMRVQGVGLFTDSTAEETLRIQAMTGVAANYELYFGNGDKISGAFLVSSYERGGKQGDMESFGVTLESMGAVGYSEV